MGLYVVNREVLIGKPRHDSPKDQWRSYQPSGRTVGTKRGSTAMDYEAMTTTMEGDPLQDDQVQRARKTAAHWFAENGLPAEQLSDTLMMLGIHPSQKDLGPSLAPNQLPNAPDGKRLVTQK